MFPDPLRAVHAAQAQRYRSDFSAEGACISAKPEVQLRLFFSRSSAFPEPHMPHVLMEEGDMAPAEYERHLKGKNDFIRGTKKDPSAEKKVRSKSCGCSLGLSSGPELCCQ